MRVGNAGLGRAALLAAFLPALLAGCIDQLAPRLELSPATYLELSAARSSVVITNAGGGSLRWRAHSDNSLVTLSAMEGRILRGASRTLTLLVDDSLLDVDDVVEATLSFDSNGGSASVTVSYTVGSGIGMCGAYLPPEVGAAARAVTQLRTAEPGATARPVPGEVLVAYRDWTPGVPVARLTAEDGVGTDVDAYGPQQRLSSVEGTLRPSAVAQSVRAELAAVTGVTLVAPGVAGTPDLYRAPDPARLIDALVDDPRVLYAHRNYYLEAQYLPNDPDLGKQWNLTLFGVPHAWDHYHGQVGDGGTVVVAVIDSGVYGAHPDLASKMLPGWDFYDNDANTDPGPSNGHAEHGTHVAGIAAASGDDGYGVAGVAYGPAVAILPVKVFDAAGVNASISDLVRAIRWSAGLAVPGVATNSNRAHVINMSLGVPGTYPALDAAAHDAWDAGSLLVGASGNHTGAMEDPGVLSPANAPCVIAVGSVDSDYEVSSFSNTGPQVELVAPGGFSNSGCARVYSTVPPPSFHDCSSGTSMAAPFVAGVAALLIGQGDHTTPAQVRDRLSNTALRASWMHDTRSYGNGVVCADTALGAVSICGNP